MANNTSAAASIVSLFFRRWWRHYFCFGPDISEQFHPYIPRAYLSFQGLSGILPMTAKVLDDKDAFQSLDQMHQRINASIWTVGITFVVL
ncbi:hypothetical protein ACVNP3_03890 [Pseudomonas chlororaphis subsp. piscium]